MTRRSRYTEDNEDLNVWQAFTDLMSNAFMILVLFLFLTIIISQMNIIQNKPDKNVVNLPLKIKTLEQELSNLKIELANQKRLTDAPPIIVIKDQGDYRFALGSAEIPPKMLSYIFRDIVPAIETTSNKYGINVVEIIGHTDATPNGNANSNLDVNLEKVVSGTFPVNKLQSGSNADLGLMRALSVVKILRDIQNKQGRLKSLSFRAYSAAQLILPNGKLAEVAPVKNKQDDQTRRRIEIRFTRLGEEQEVGKQ
ncbi:MAG: flagellar motor protein [Nostocales cyanobacterium]|nr:MAG: flagellar motor protein [Nostocales cyanobacterium]